jgi:hypothetical protein
MKVKDLIKQLEAIANQEAEISLLGNVSNPDDEETDIRFDMLELWEDGEESITLFVGLTHETLDRIREQEKEL